MPAIQPTRLKHQAADLAELFGQPTAFVRSLHHVLDFYADRAHRPGLTGEPASLLAAYNVRSPVMRQIIQDLASRVDTHIEAALALVDALWEQPYLEFHQLSAALLGKIPVDPPEPVFQRFVTWTRSGSDGGQVAMLADLGLARLRREKLDFLLRQVEGWLIHPDDFQQRLGLVTLLPMVEDANFDYFPVFFRLVHPLTRKLPASLRPDLLDVLAALARRSPVETAFLLRQNLELANSTDTPWLIRQCLRYFPFEQQENLRMAARLAEQTQRQSRR